MSLPFFLSFFPKKTRDRITAQPNENSHETSIVELHLYDPVGG